MITITLYLGTGEWNAPRSLMDMMPKIDERVLPFINDYKINLLNPSDITDFSKFQTGLRPLFEVLKNARDERRLNEVISSDETFKNVDVEIVAAINLFAGMDIKIEKEDEVLNMCKAWDEHKNRGIQEGIQVGKQEGIQEGRCLEIYSLVQDGILDPEVGAKRINMSLQDFEEKMQNAGYKLPELA